MKYELWIADCVTAEGASVDKSPLLIGTHPSCDLFIDGTTPNTVACRFTIGLGGVKVEPGSKNRAEVTVRGNRLRGKQSVKRAENIPFFVDTNLFMVRFVDVSRIKKGALNAWLEHLRGEWRVDQLNDSEMEPQGCSIGNLIWLFNQGHIEGSDLAFPGQSRTGFLIRDISKLGARFPESQPPWFHNGPPPVPLITPVPAATAGSDNPVPVQVIEERYEQVPESVHVHAHTAAPEAETPPAPAPPKTREIGTEHGDFTCPVCWLKFDGGDVMHIAVHDDLRGDELMGEDKMRRFHATRFNDRRQALDEKNIPCTDIACPHCRRRLPHGFLEVKHHIFSIVGAPSSGKTYYLATLIRSLKRSLHREFSINFRDFDPEGNSLLNAMIGSLFSATSPEGAFLRKTDLEGEMYEELPRYGQKVRLPKPFIYSMVSESGGNPQAIVVYDNAGEHFEPGRDSAHSPGAQHLASSAGIFFLFDPTSNADFRRRLKGKSDPQLKNVAVDQQDVLLSETDQRVKKLLGLNPAEKISVPFAMIIGKCDVWLDELGEDSMKPAIRDGAVDLEAIEDNSKRLRSYLDEICPDIVSSVDSIAENVAYFPMSPFGHTPVSFTHPTLGKIIGPDPKKMNPLFVEVPFVWALSKVAPELIPSFQ